MPEIPDISSDVVADIADAINAVNVDEHLVRNSELGVLNFESGRSDFETARAIAAQIRSLPTERMRGTSGYDQVRDALLGLFAKLQEVASFDPTTGDPGALRNRLIEDVRALNAHVLQTLLPIAGYLVLLSGGLGDIRSQLEQALATWRSEAASALSDAQAELLRATELANKSAQTAELAAAAAQTAAARTGVVEHARVFAEEAETHRLESHSWLQRTIAASLGVVFVTLVLVLIPVGDDISEPKVVQLILLKGLVVSLGITAVLLCVRMFRTERHLHIVNRHRDLALRTFQTFAEGARSEPVRDAVLLEATRAIFAPGITGMLDQASANSGSPPISVMEILRGPQSSGGSST